MFWLQVDLIKIIHFILGYAIYKIYILKNALKGCITAQRMRVSNFQVEALISQIAILRYPWKSWNRYGKKKEEDERSAKLRCNKSEQVMESAGVRICCHGWYVFYLISKIWNDWKPTLSPPDEKVTKPAYLLKLRSGFLGQLGWVSFFFFCFGQSSGC